MTIEIRDASPKALETKPKKKSVTYPFDELEVGQCFTMPTDEINWQSLRTRVYQKNQKTDKEFVFVKHDDCGLCEVARIA